MHLTQTLSSDVCVNGRCRDISMTQKHLDCAQIRTVIQQVRRKGMAQGVG